MAHVITDDCQMCGSCIPVCPSEAIKEGEIAMEKEIPKLLQLIEMKKKDVI